jgi:hypothetical protein
MEELKLFRSHTSYRSAREINFGKICLISNRGSDKTLKKIGKNAEQLDPDIPQNRGAEPLGTRTQTNANSQNPSLNAQGRVLVPHTLPLCHANGTKSLSSSCNIH